MNALLIAATVAVVSTVPAPLSNGNVLFHKNELVITFNQPVVTHSIKVVDNDKCQVSQGSKADGDKVIVALKACQRMGFPPGHMDIEWTVNGEKGGHQLHIGKHH